MSTTEFFRHSAHPPAIQALQDVLRDHPDRMCRWAQNPSILADNNRAEQELRLLVIGRKISFGPQSEAGPGSGRS
jgi:hypothetical protein